MSIAIEESIESILSEGGELASRLPGYALRESQLSMSLAIQKAIESSGTLLVEAETGTGKTFAYLIPIILSRKKAIISTGTKHLQDQLFQKDLPVLKQFLPMTVALLKGRANYLCSYRLQLIRQQGLLYDKQEVADFSAIETWARETVSGDKAEVKTVSENASIWSQVTSTAENCLGRECPFFEDCYVVKARKQASLADVVIVNHHLFFADLSIKEEGFGEILPTTEVIVFDEAHQVPDIASRFFSEVFSSRELLELGHDMVLTALVEAPDISALSGIRERLEKNLLDIRLCFGLEVTRAAWKKPQGVLAAAIEKLNTELVDLLRLLEELSVRGPGLKQIYDRAVLLTNLWKRIIAESQAEFIHWYETHPKNFSVYLTPVSIQEPLQALLQRQSQTNILTSATLTVANQFDYFANQMGLTTYEALQFSSPFNFKQQALLYIPKHITTPAQPNYTEKWLRVTLPLIEACQGRTFILFTSYQALEQAYQILKNALTLPLFKQGDKPKQILLEDFCQAGNGVLLGTYSFWEGVDVRGSALSCVIIDKLPFTSPKDPIVEARMQLLEKQGQNPFSDYQLPQAVVALKQGIGRLIRDVTDTGVLIIADPRLVTRSYGALFFASFPAMKVTRQFSLCQQFIAEVLQ